MNLFRLKKLLVQRWIRASFDDTPAPTAGAVDGKLSLHGMDQTGTEPAGGEDAGTHAAGGVMDGTLRATAGSGSVPAIFEPSAEETRRVLEEENELRVVYVLASLPAAATEPGAGAGVSAGAGAGAGAPAADGDSKEPPPSKPADTTPTGGALALVQVAFAQQATKSSYRARARALACAFRLLPAGDVCRLADRPLADLAEYWRLCLHMAEFDLLRIPQTLAALRTCSKPALVRGLWRDHRDSPRAVRLIASLMLDFHVNDVNLWVAVLGSLVSSGQHRAVLKVLAALCDEHWSEMLRASKKFATMFDQVAMLPFQEMTRATAGDAVDPTDAWFADHPGVADVLGQVVLLLQRCPVLHLLQVDKYVASFQALGPPFAAHTLRVAMLHPTAHARAAAVQQALHATSYVTAVRELVDAAPAAIDAARKRRAGGAVGGVPQDAMLLTEVFKAMDAAGAHGVLVGTPFMKSFTAYLLAAGDIDRLLKYTLSTENVADAAALVRLHVHGSGDGGGDDADPMETLVDFIEGSDALAADATWMLATVNAQTEE